MHEKMQTYCKKKNVSINYGRAQSALLKQHQGWKGEMEGKQGKLSNAKRKKVQLNSSKYRNMLYF